MNFFPLINRSKKAQSFANPLNGLTFHNDSVIQSVHRQGGYSTISYNETNTNRSNVAAEKAKSSNKLRAQRTQSSLQKTTLLPLKSKLLKHASLFQQQNSSTLINNLSTSLKKNQFVYPQVEIIPLYLINHYQDISRFTMYMHLQKYFKFYFKNDFRHNSIKLNSILEKYIPYFKKYDMLDKQIIKKKWPKQFWQIKTLKQLFDCFQKYQKPHQYWIKHILILIQLYFMPHASVRKTTLENLILVIKMQIKHQFKISESNQELVFLLETGELVEDFIDIPISAAKLFLTKKQATKEQTMKAFDRHNEMIKAYKQQCKKKGLITRLRKHFRKQIVNDKYYEQTINYDPDFSSKEKERKISLHRAMKILEKKKNNQLQPKTISTITRPKSQSQIWKQQNVEGSSLYEPLTKFSFHINLNSKSIENQLKRNFEYYNQLSRKDNQQMVDQVIYIYILQRHHPTLSAITGNTFHSMKLKRVYQILLDQKIANDHQIAKTTINWKQFVELSILTHKHLKKLIKLPDCLYLLRNFVEGYLEMEDQYFRDEMTSKLYHLIEGDSSTVSMMEEVIWNWLVQNNLVAKGVIRRQFLWNYPQKSSIFYLLIVEMIFATYQTTPLDLAYELLV